MKFLKTNYSSSPMLKDKIKNPFFVFYGLLVIWIALYTSYKPTRGSRVADFEFMRSHVLKKFKPSVAPHFYNLRTGVDDEGEIPYFYLPSKLVILPKKGLIKENEDLMAFSLAHEDARNNPISTFWDISIVLIFFVYGMIVICLEKVFKVPRERITPGKVLVCIWFFYAFYSFFIEIAADRYAVVKFNGPEVCLNALDRQDKLDLPFQYQRLVRVRPPISMRKWVCSL